MAVVLNATVVNPSTGGHLTLFGAGAPQPATSTLNFQPGRTRANNAILGTLGTPGTPATLGALCAGGGTADLVIDVSGYFR